MEKTMSGDYSRFSFDPRRNYSGVLMQQGRVLLDQDWNERTAIDSRAFRAAVVDILGRVFLPMPRAFKIEEDGRGGFTIGRGRVYVDGLVAENHGAGSPIWDPALDEQHGAEPVSYTQQPYLPSAPELPTSGGPYLVYLDVWQREVTALEDPDLVDAALEGSDTTTRLQTVWQVKLCEASSVNAKRPLDEDRKFKPATSRLSTIPGSYTGVDNQLYRVEVHDPGKIGAATFKWSRDNASIGGRVTRLIDLSQLVVQAVGSQAGLGITGGDLIEITDDAREFAGLPGELRRIKAINAASSAVTLDAPLSPSVFLTDQNGIPDAARHMRVQRWQGKQPIKGPGNQIDLENGIAIRFDAGADFRTADYWLIPARSADQSFKPLNRAPPRGIHHHFVKLALFTTPRRLRDLRPQRIGRATRSASMPK
jgi:hypothetical protein